MERKSVTIREDQKEWVDEQDINLSQLVQDAIDEEMSPTESELAAAYQANADHAAETNEAWSMVSTEATQHLGEPPRDERIFSEEVLYKRISGATTMTTPAEVKSTDRVVRW